MVEFPSLSPNEFVKGLSGLSLMGRSNGLVKRSNEPSQKSSKN